MHIFPAGHHDAGALDPSVLGELDTQDKPWAFWERRTHAVVWRLLARGHLTLDELRRAVEGLPEAEAARSYYEKWAAAAAEVCLERGVLSRADLDAALGPEPPSEQPPRFRAGDLVRVLRENAPLRWRRPHLRTPGYIFGLVGRVERECVGAFKDPERGAFREPGPRVPLYRVRFAQCHVWEGYGGGANDTVDIEIYQPWLEPASEEDLERQARAGAAARGVLRGGPGSDCTRHAHAHTHGHGHSHDDGHGHSHDHEHSHIGGAAAAQHGHSHSQSHDHAHSHGHSHGPGGAVHSHDGGEPHVHEAREQVEQAAVDREGDDSARSRLPEALYGVLLDKGVLTAAEVTAEMEAMDARGASGNGARLVARAWEDAAFKARLLADAVTACAELGVPTSNIGPAPGAAPAAAPAPDTAAAAAAPAPAPAAAPGLAAPRGGTILTAVANEPGVHNLVVCTLCSCYPISVLGLSPHWYRSRAYRCRAVRDPRGVLAEFGTALPEGTAVRVHDSTADLRYIVIPERPPGTEGWDEARLARLVTRDSMIGVRPALTPAQLEEKEREDGQRAAAAAAAAAGAVGARAAA
ncbi:nitrile hydratase subunit alpha [Raphidocelis subcapitata]|uniref:nitrile hydratase n=1 Tax=Raphidocelis subcapitata TaxID=307507 RepID=A0A2V0NSX7_9CHLO|nr:nitrile hydratase subunit alpha [Raphidocelis subcapitata]|eukprot:GBF90736.1 nitrile hydratase subunit alpha [Raphidocelis subcapitata]